MKICLIGTQGTGKSTLVNHFKENYKVIDNVARDCIVAGHNSSENGDVSGQSAIFDAYLKALYSEKNYISTRSLLDVVAYTRYLMTHSDDVQLKNLYIDQVNEIKLWYKQNPDIVFCYVPIEFEIEDDGVRSIDKQYQLDIDQNMTYILQQMNVPYYIISGTLEERKQKLGYIIKEINLRGVDNHMIKTI